MRPAFILALLLAPIARAEEQSFDSNGVKIHFVAEGRGEPVVLVHGFGGSAAMWGDAPPFGAKLIAPLAKSYRVIALDCRGHGRSGKPHDPAKYGAEMAEDVVRLLDHLRLTKAHVVGYSMGATIAGKLLSAHPVRLHSVTFGGGAPLFRPTREFRAVIDATAAALDKGEGIGPLLVALTPPGQPKPTPAEAAAVSKGFLQGQDQTALAAVLRGQKGLEVQEAELKANTVPVAFVYGSREAGVTGLIAESRKVLPAATVRVIDGGTHITTLVMPEFRKAVLDFLGSHRQ